MENKKLYIGGQWVESEGRAWIEVENPANGTIIAKVPDSSTADVDKAVEAAKAGLEIWKNTSPKKRAAFLYDIADYIEQHSEEIGRIITKELGAPVKIAKSWHVDSCPEEARYYAKLAEEYSYEQRIPGAIICREPVGVVAALTPWNYPLDQVSIKVLPALAAGNSIILKPSQLTPLSAYCFAEAAEAIGLPAGVFNLITGRGSSIGNYISAHPEIQMISFTGSTDTGRSVARHGLENIKKIALELGGKSACVLLKDGKVEDAVNFVLKDCFMNTGQTCSATTRMLVPNTLLSEVESEIQKKAVQFKVGNPEEADTDIGPLISRKQFDKVKKYIKIGLEEGAKLLVGEIPIECKEGYYINPVVFTEVTNQMTIAREEIFGPVLCIISYETEEEALFIANDSIYGLSGAVFGEKEHAKQFALKMQTGNVHINGADYVTGAPFGGYKQSGLGREFDSTSFEEYMEIKALFI